MMKKIKRVLALFIMLVAVFTFMPVIDGQVYAASKKPAAPQITYAKEVTDVSDDFKIVLVKWKKVKGAKKYQTAIRSESKTWVKVKTVKKSKKNKKKYTKANKYRVVAKGKKYIVYEYKYKYAPIYSTKECSFRFSDAPGWQDLQPDTTYLFAVRSVNGKKYSEWKTVAVKTSLAAFESKDITTPGASQTITLKGKKVTFTIGKNCTLPVPSPKKGTVEVKTFSMVPAKIEYNLSRDKQGIDESVNIEGKSPEGLDAHYSLSVERGELSRVSYSAGDVYSGNGFKCEGLGSGPGFIGLKYTVTDPNVTIVWALDGTTPKIGQADKTINASEYPYNPVTSNGAPYNGTVKVRGTASYDNGSESIWGGIKRAYFNRCEWIRLYRGNTLSAESFTLTNYDYEENN